ncbi:MAG: hypothetical protein V1807_00210 [Patescibacteria group bacterium]
MYLCSFSVMAIGGESVRRSQDSPSQSEFQPDPKLAQVGIIMLSAGLSHVLYRELVKDTIKFQKKITGGTSVIAPDGVFRAAGPVCLIGYMMPPEPDHLIVLSDIANICKYRGWIRVWLIVSRGEKNFERLSQQLSGLGLEVINAPKTEK